MKIRPVAAELFHTDGRTDIIIIIIIIFINCNWVITQWQWLFYMYTNMGKKK